MSGGNRRSEDHGDVPWPALVDLLTSVLITFMFFVLVTTVAMSTMTVKTAMEAAKRKEAEAPPQDGEKPADQVSPSSVIQPVSTTEPASATQIPVPERNADVPLPPLLQTRTLEPPSELLTENDKLREENRKLKEQLSALTTSFSKSTEITTRTDQAAHELVLMFRKNEAGMLPQTQADIAKFIERNRAALAAGRLELTAAQPQGVNFSQSREQALTRGMVVRNVLLEMKLDPSKIRIAFTAEALDDSHDWVRLRIVPQNPQPGESPVR